MVLQVIVKVYVDAGRQQQAADIIAKLPLEQKIKSLILIGLVTLFMHRFHFQIFRVQ